MKALIAITLLSLPLFANASAAPGVAQMICFDRVEYENNVERNFVIVMEQTNPEEQDGRVLLDPKTFKNLSPDVKRMSFRVRVFKNAPTDMNNTKLPQLANTLMGPDMPSNSYQEWTDGTSLVKLRRLTVTWDRKNEAKFQFRNLEYRPESKDREYYGDSVTGADSREITCEPPFLKTEEPQPAVEPEAHAELYDDSYEDPYGDSENAEIQVY